MTLGKVHLTVKRLLTTLGAVGALLLALNRIGDTPVAPGYSTGFTKQASCQESSLCFTTDAGDLAVLVRLSVLTSSDTAGQWHAQLGNGRVLRVMAESKGDRRWDLWIMKSDTTRLVKFEWSSGLPLILSNTRPMRLDVQDWTVWPQNNPHDSRSRARGRTIWFLVSLAFIIIGVASIVVEKLSERAPEESDLNQRIAELVRRMIAEVQVDGQDSAKVQAMLTQVLFGSVPPREAVRRLAPSETLSRQAQLWFKTRNAFFMHYDQALGRLHRYRQDLDWS